MRSFKFTTLPFVVCALSLGALSVQAAEPAAASATATSATIAGVHNAKVTSRVVAVDTSARTLTLAYPKGEQTVIEVGEEVKNLAKIKVGSLVLTRYADSLNMAPAKDPSAKSVYTVTIKNPVARVADLHGPAGLIRVKIADTAGYDALSINQKLDVTSTKRVASELSTVARRKAAAAPAAQASQ